MSKGSDRITLRLPARLLAAMQGEIRRYNAHPLCVPIDISEFIRRAVAADLAHRARGRACSRARALTRQCQTPSSVTGLAEDGRIVECPGGTVPPGAIDVSRQIAAGLAAGRAQEEV